MDSELLKSLASEVPNLLVFVAVVIVFLKAQRSLAEQFTKYLVDKDVVFIETLRQNTEVIRENSKVLGAVESLMREK